MGTMELPIKQPENRIDGFPSYLRTSPQTSPDTTSEEYAGLQAEGNAKKTLDFLLPILKQCGAKRVLDVGCGIGTMVRTLLDQGCEAYGADLPGLSRFWREQAHPFDNFFIIDAANFELPFADETVDFAFSFGVIEHVGTSDGHYTRLGQYRQIRRQWLREVYRTVRPGGYMLIGGPNRNFPVDVAHGLDSQASNLERTLSRWVGASVHKTWGEYFLWSYGDFPEYLEGLPYSLRALSIDQFLSYSRVPRLVRPLVRLYSKRLPGPLLCTGFNPWVMALIQKPPIGTAGDKV